jgi:hypothetical protein
MSWAGVGDRRIYIGYGLDRTAIPCLDAVEGIYSVE